VSKTRLEAFSDGVIAILVTIMVLELRTPHGTIYWNNHHHMLAAVTRISGMTLWANQHLLFWLSLIPVATAWMSENHFPPIPVAAYGVVLLAASLAYSILQATLLRTEGDRSALAAAVGTDVKGRASSLMYGLGIGLSFADRWAGIAAYVAVALMWFIPDRRVERTLTGAHEDRGRNPP
jgi:uncharacterized membrane protein